MGSPDGGYLRRNAMRSLSKVCLVLILTVICTSLTHSATDPPRALSVKGSEANLYASPREDAAVMTQLKKGLELTPLAQILGGGGKAWYMVRTAQGVVGWMKPDDVQESEKLEKLFEAKSSEPEPAIVPEPLLTPEPELPKNAIMVPVEMDGPAVIVPVVLNRSIETRMILDTGATFSSISPRIAQQLGLRLGTKVSVITPKGTTSTPLARLGSLKVGDAEVYSLLVTVLDFAPDPRIEGLLGLDFLRRFHTSIDSRRQLLILAPR